MKIKNNFKSDYNFPAYNQRDGQYTTDRAYIYLDLKDGEINVDYSESNHMSSDEFNGTLLTFGIDSALANSEIQELITDISDDLQAIFDGSDTEWVDGNWKATLSDAANDAIERVEAVCRNRFTDYAMVDRDMVMEQCYYVEFDKLQSFDDAVATVIDSVTSGDALAADDFDLDSDAENVILEHFEEKVNSEEIIPVYAAKEIIDRGIMPEWKDDLLEMINEK